MVFLAYIGNTPDTEDKYGILGLQWETPDIEDKYGSSGLQWEYTRYWR